MKARFEGGGSGGGDSTASESSPPTSLDSVNCTPNPSNITPSPSNITPNPSNITPNPSSSNPSSSSSNSTNSNSNKNSGHLSATERRRQFRRAALSEGSLKRAATRLSTASLHDTLASEAVEVVEAVEAEPLQRRNSIHNVPYVDVNDPETRARMERYKEERRTLLRARYKAEDYKTKKTTEVSQVSHVSQVSQVSQDSKAREGTDSPSPLPKKRGEGQQPKGGRLRKDSFGKGKATSKVTPRSSGRFSLQEKTVVDFKVPLRQMPIEAAPSFKKASVSDFYHNHTTTRAGNSSQMSHSNSLTAKVTPERKWSAPASKVSQVSQVSKKEKERTPSPGRLSAVRGSSRNVNNNKERAPSPKSASSAASSRPRNTPSPRLGSSSPSQGQGQAQGQGQNRRPSSFPATTSSNNGDEDVNVKERAAIFGPRKSSGRGKLPGIVNATPGRKKSESASTSSSEAPGSPSKIKNMAALFENA